MQECTFLCSVFSGCKVESIYLNVDAVNTHRDRPEVGISTYSHTDTDLVNIRGNLCYA